MRRAIQARRTQQGAVSCRAALMRATPVYVATPLSNIIGYPDITRAPGAFFLCPRRYRRGAPRQRATFAIFYSYRAIVYNMPAAQRVALFDMMRRSVLICARQQMNNILRALLDTRRYTTIPRD